MKRKSKRTAPTKNATVIMIAENDIAALNRAKRRSAMAYQKIDVRRLSGALGAEVAGLSLSERLNEKVLTEIEDAFHRHLVLIFRNQHLTPQQHSDFSAQFAGLVPHPFVQSLEGLPGIVEIVKEPDEVVHWGGTCFHADLTFLEEPPIGAALYAREIPPCGGDTIFVNMYLAYETLSEGMKRLLEKLEVVHESSPPEEYSTTFFKGMREKQNRAASAVHPAVVTHPKTGRRSLYVNQGYAKRFCGMSAEESRPLLDYLVGHSLRPEFTCRVRWAPGSMVMWDNRVTLHCAVGDDFEARNGGNGHRRVLHRATFAGERPH